MFDYFPRILLFQFYCNTLGSISFWTSDDLDCRKTLISFRELYSVDRYRSILILFIYEDCTDFIKYFT